MIRRFQVAVVPLALAVGVCALTAGCSSNPSRADSVYQQLQDDNPSRRVEAIVRVGQEKDPKAVPYLVDRLEDQDADVRLYAILALERITGQNFGYEFYQDEMQRRPAVEKWRQWLQSQPPGPASVATRPPVSAALRPGYPCSHGVAASAAGEVMGR